MPINEDGLTVPRLTKIHAKPRHSLPYAPARAEMPGHNRQRIELWLDGASTRIESMHRVPPVAGELVPGQRVQGRYRVLRVEPARPRERVPMRVVVERVE